MEEGCAANVGFLTDWEQLVVVGAGLEVLTEWAAEPAHPHQVSGLVGPEFLFGLEALGTFIL